jgi:hypothetical protein
MGQALKAPMDFFHPSDDQNPGALVVVHSSASSVFCLKMLGKPALHSNHNFPHFTYT